MKKEQLTIDPGFIVGSAESVGGRASISEGDTFPIFDWETGLLSNQKENFRLLKELNSLPSESPTQTSQLPLFSEPTTNSTNEKSYVTLTGVQSMGSTSELKPCLPPSSRPKNLETVIYYWP